MDNVCNQRYTMRHCLSEKVLLSPVESAKSRLATLRGSSQAPSAILIDKSNPNLENIIFKLRLNFSNRFDIITFV